MIERVLLGTVVSTIFLSALYSYFEVEEELDPRGKISVKKVFSRTIKYSIICLMLIFLLSSIAAIIFNNVITI